MSDSEHVLQWHWSLRVVTQSPLEIKPRAQNLDPGPTRPFPGSSPRHPKRLEPKHGPTLVRRPAEPVPMSPCALGENLSVEGT